MNALTLMPWADASRRTRFASCSSSEMVVLMVNSLINLHHGIKRPESEVWRSFFIPHIPFIAAKAAVV